MLTTSDQGTFAAAIGERSPEGQETMSATSSAAAPAGTALHWYRLTVVLLGVALVAMIALTVYLAATRTISAAGSPTPPAPPAPSQVDQCYQPAVPC